MVPEGPDEGGVALGAAQGPPGLDTQWGEITPVVVSPGHAQVVPLRPEFSTPQDGQAE